MKPSFIVLLLVSPMLPANPLTRNSDWISTTKYRAPVGEEFYLEVSPVPRARFNRFTFNPNHYETQSL